jgi:hypothetical protein
LAQQFKFISHVKVTNRKGDIGYKETPYVRLRQGDHAPVMIQGGVYYEAGGKALDEDKIPDWTKEHVRNMSPDAREAVGLPRRVAAKPHESLAK